MKHRNKKTQQRIAKLAIALCCLLSITFSSLPLTAFATTEPRVVRVGYYENEVFQEGAGEGLVKTGYAYEYYQKISEYTGWKYEYIYGGFGDLYQMLLDGEIDLLAGLAYREERKDTVGYPSAIMGSESYYLVKHDTDTEITTDPSTLTGKSIGVLDSAMSSVLNQFLSENGIQANVVVFPEHTSLFGAFDAHEVDVLAAESDGAYGRDHAEPLLAFGTSDYYLCVNKQKPDLLVQLNEAQTQEFPQFSQSQVLWRQRQSAGVFRKRAGMARGARYTSHRLFGTLSALQ